MGGGSGAHWVLSPPKVLTLESPLAVTINMSAIVQSQFCSLG